MPKGRPTMRPEVEYWVALADEDLASAQTLARGAHHLNAVYHCHQALEKMLKALIQQAQADPPPRTHDLLGLAARAGAWGDMSAERRELLLTINPYGTQARYPAPGVEPAESVGPGLAEDIVSGTTEAMAWLKQRLT